MKASYTVEIYRARNGEIRSRIIAKNGKIIFDSGEGYGRVRDCAKAYYHFESACQAGLIFFKNTVVRKPRK